MKELKSITSNEWLDLVNRESHPSLEHFEEGRIQLGDQYAAYISSGYGTFLSTLVNNVEELDALEIALKEKYDGIRKTSKEFKPTFGFQG